MLSSVQRHLESSIYEGLCTELCVRPAWRQPLLTARQKLSADTLTSAGDGCSTAGKDPDSDWHGGSYAAGLPPKRGVLVEVGLDPRSRTSSTSSCQSMLVSIA